MHHYVMIKLQEWVFDGRGVSPHLGDVGGVPVHSSQKMFGPEKGLNWGVTSLILFSVPKFFLSSSMVRYFR